MLHVIQIVRYTMILILIPLILVQNPKVDNINTFSRSHQLFDSMHSAQNVLQSITWIAILTVFLSTVLLASLDI